MIHLEQNEDFVPNVSFPNQTLILAHRSVHTYLLLYNILCMPNLKQIHSVVYVLEGNPFSKNVNFGDSREIVTKFLSRKTVTKTPQQTEILNLYPIVFDVGV